ncbi:disease resistance protein SUMM2-like [Neltuma alba]|uniref:disease resistance protein SUMM2-like n=1 Tax=Neltuma alba TaxID=207710 RepID=UPI0010A3D795|nr:disease resistance protein SUMM2-like [Prosopis alba]
MSEFIPLVIDILTCFCGYCAKWADSIRNLGEKLNSLESASKQLDDMYHDVKMKVEAAEQDPRLTVLNRARGWMRREEELRKEVEDIVKQGRREIQAKFFGGHCPKNCRAIYKLQKMVDQKLSDVDDLTSEGHFDVVAEKISRYMFYELPVAKLVGVESTFEKLCSCFENNPRGIIGLRGMGGVGKTSLLRKFNNDFLSKKANNVVIWVVVSKDADEGKIQVAIRKKLNVTDDEWNNKTVDERAVVLWNILKNKEFVLLLDDVWERIDLLKLGVPSPNNHECKIIFTTRLEEVCGWMGADADGSIKVNCLPPDKAYDLFKEKVGDATLEQPNISSLAKQVVEECKGLPLALCTAFPTEAFVLPSTVKVLDFSSNYGIRDVPSEIGDFVNLEHMNLSNTRIRKLPEELKNLKKLKVLLLDRMHVLEFPEKVISGLLSLQAFSTRRSKLGGIDENVLLNELEGLDRLRDIRISVFSTSSVEKILNSPKLQRCMCELFVTRVHSSLRDLFSSLGNMKHLETLKVDASEVAETPRSLFRRT